MKNNKQQMKRKEGVNVNQQLTLKVIENANEAIKSVFHFSQWMIINQGNDYY